MNLVRLNEKAQELQERLDFYQGKIIKSLQDKKSELPQGLKYLLDCYEIINKELWKIRYDTNYKAESK